MDVDERGFRVALVADEFVNPPADGVDALAVLTEEGWGAIQLPPEWYPPTIAGPLLEQVAEHAEEFGRHGYDVVLIGDRAGLGEALQGVGLEPPKSTRPSSGDELRAFLRSRPAVDVPIARPEAQ
jgi:hypothetical protein